VADPAWTHWGSEKSLAADGGNHTLVIQAHRNVIKFGFDVLLL
jgi:hypothetical protein